MTMFRKARIDLSAIRPEKIRTAAITTLQRGGRLAQRELAQRFRKEQVYADGSGWERLRSVSPEWKRYKLRRGLSPLRGHATGALQKAIGSKQAFIEREDGFVISPARANFPGLGGQALNTYYRHYNTAKAYSSIGVLGREQRRRITRATREAVEKQVRKALKTAKGWWRNELLTIRLAVERMEIFG